IIDLLKYRKAASVKVCALTDKPGQRLVKDVKADYVGIEVPKEFLVGYGLDYQQKYRNLPYLGVLKPEIYTKGKKYDFSNLLWYDRQDIKPDRRIKNYMKNPKRNNPNNPNNQNPNRNMMRGRFFYLLLFLAFMGIFQLFTGDLFSGNKSNEISASEFV